MCKVIGTIKAGHSYLFPHTNCVLGEMETRAILVQIVHSLKIRVYCFPCIYHHFQFECPYICIVPFHLSMSGYNIFACFVGKVILSLVVVDLWPLTNPHLGLVQLQPRLRGLERIERDFDL